jgi:hypothetical protein
MGDKNMGYRTKVQRVDRPTNQSFSVNIPAALALSIEIEKGEEFEWIIEDKNLLLLKRVKPTKKKTLKNR